MEFLYFDPLTYQNVVWGDLSYEGKLLFFQSFKKSKKPKRYIKLYEILSHKYGEITAAKIVSEKLSIDSMHEGIIEDLI